MIYPDLKADSVRAHNPVLAFCLVLVAIVLIGGLVLTFGTVGWLVISDRHMHPSVWQQQPVAPGPSNPVPVRRMQY